MRKVNENNNFIQWFLLFHVPSLTSRGMHTLPSWYCCEHESKTGREEKKLLNKVIIFVFFAHKRYSCSFITLQLNHWCQIWTILMMSLLPFWALSMSVALLSMEVQRALRFHQKYFNLCSEEEWRSYRIRTTWEWVTNDRISISLTSDTLTITYNHLPSTFVKEGNNWITFFWFLKCMKEQIWL